MNTYRPIMNIISTRRREIILDGFIVASMPQRLVPIMHMILFK
ncbi:hypothetical protein [Vibrio sp. UCD-FRSSP16_10]|nr:hypothetical protein [Vibrio sp. UCD-FRSSP16_10]